ncbi:MAG: hypothetical protein BGO55_30375 [Sphingobacteriales bacterium 50-39]|nr:hypothetical protein [Sphingobacteriales bacterium]OJW60827.1 MAG: hypothetical protein BGO55_30375 [Sphingobacteriales bacterium 50-39]
MKTHKVLLIIVAFALAKFSYGQDKAAAPFNGEKILGLYMHQHWSYNHPYAVRTWSMEDWKAFLGSLHQLGYNYALIWPMLETMPDPLTPSDSANIKKIARVIDYAHQVLQMKVGIVLCPNVAPNNEEAAKYTFEKRPFFHTDERVDPGDPVAFGKLMAWREKLFLPLKEADGVYIIDSDPGGYPNSSNLEFVYILNAHRKMLDHFRPGIEVVYWAHFGWVSYSKFYATGNLISGTVDEPRDAITLMSKQHMEPWGVASSRYGPHLADAIGMGDRVINFPYGAIEDEPSFPLTLYGGDRATKGGSSGGERGVIGNAQSHVVQLPNIFAFARAAQGLSISKEDYIHFADDLIPGMGIKIVEGWEALQGQDPARMRKAAQELDVATKKTLPVGKLAGLMFNNASRYLNDLFLQLNMAASLYDFRKSLDGGDKSKIKMSLTLFADAAAAWQKKHGYSSAWYWPPMSEALHRLHDPSVDAVLDEGFVAKEGDNGFDRVKKGLATMETETPRLIEAMKGAAARMK